MKSLLLASVTTILLSGTAYANVVCDAAGNCIANSPPPIAASPPPVPAPARAQPPVYNPRPVASRPSSAPNKLQMNCHPTDSAPYFVTYNGYAGTILITGSDTGRTRSYPVRDIQDNTGPGIFYVNAKRQDQKRTMYFAFNYSNDGGDGGIRVKGINSDGIYTDTRDACTPTRS
jgi:hypothetical protein